MNPCRGLNYSSCTLLGILVILVLLMLELKSVVKSNRAKLDTLNFSSRVVRPLQAEVDDLHRVYRVTRLSSAPNRMASEMFPEFETSLYAHETHRKCPGKYQNFSETDLSAFAGTPQVSAYSLTNRTMEFDKKVVILTPVSKSAYLLVHYFQLLCSLSYPHHLITVVLGEDSSGDDTFTVAQTHAKILSRYFRGVRVVHFNHTMPENPGFGKHNEFFQKKRRGHLAKARNMLLFEGIGDADVVLWIDVDVLYYPPDIIQHLLGENKDVIAPSCMYRNEETHTLDIYDRNSWQETNHSLEDLKLFGEDHLRLEGYTKTMRVYLPHVNSSSHIVPLDGVGGCVLMVRGDCHRKGLIFPACLFRNHIETEGLAKMAAQMEFGVYGLPKVQVVHW